MGTIANSIASRTLSSFHNARATLFQRHAALLVAENGVYLIYGFKFEFEGTILEIENDTDANGNIFVSYPIKSIIFPRERHSVQESQSMREFLEA